MQLHTATLSFVLGFSNIASARPVCISSLQNNSSSVESVTSTFEKLVVIVVSRTIVSDAFPCDLFVRFHMRLTGTNSTLVSSSSTKARCDGSSSDLSLPYISTTSFKTLGSSSMMGPSSSQFCPAVDGTYDIGHANARFCIQVTQSDR